MATRVTVKGQVTLPKQLREAAGIRPGQLVNIRPHAEGGVVVESVQTEEAAGEYMRMLQDMIRRKPISAYTTEEIMEISRGEI